MIRYFRFYVLPLAMILIAFAMLFGGIWLWLPSLCFVFGIALMDHLFPMDLDEQDYKHPFLLDVALYLSTPAAMAMFLSLFWVAGSGERDALGVGALVQTFTSVDVITLRNQTSWYHFALMMVAIAIPITAAGGLAGHELTHRTWKPFDLWLGRFTMALNWGIAFPIEHVYGHHAYVGTPKDPATAARGDSLYRHLPKALYRTIVNAWEIEAQRLDKLDLPLLSHRNTLLRLGLISLSTTMIAYWLAGWMGVAFHLTICLVTKVMLEVLNYVEHYGMVRLPTEPVQPRHSWNCNHLISGVFTYNLTRHSHHHAHAQVPFQDLRAYPDQPEMPGGLMSAYITAFVPWLWRRAITPKLREWDRVYASDDEKQLVSDANRASAWAELCIESVATETPGEFRYPKIKGR